jgi:hypothetical protein
MVSFGYVVTGLAAVSSLAAILGISFVSVPPEIASPVEPIHKTDPPPLRNPIEGLAKPVREGVAPATTSRPSYRCLNFSNAR